jgi:hypothetical protein
MRDLRYYGPQTNADIRGRLAPHGKEAERIVRGMVAEGRVIDEGGTFRVPRNPW